MQVDLLCISEVQIEERRATSRRDLSKAQLSYSTLSVDDKIDSAIQLVRHTPGRILRNFFWYSAEDDIPSEILARARALTSLVDGRMKVKGPGNTAFIVLKSAFVASNQWCRRRASSDTRRDGETKPQETSKWNRQEQEGAEGQARRERLRKTHGMRAPGTINVQTERPTARARAKRRTAERREQADTWTRAREERGGASKLEKTREAPAQKLEGEM